MGFCGLALLDMVCRPNPSRIKTSRGERRPQRDHSPFPCSCAVHMDCMHWVNRDSYLPQGSRGLKVRQPYRDAIAGHSPPALYCDYTGRNPWPHTPLLLVAAPGTVAMGAVGRA